ncbi:MAG: hypothetical protein HYX32_09435 [Actinobacteria bacterium]|nr:hypothetical protein [Actinomycetota bacterium]
MAANVHEQLVSLAQSALSPGEEVLGAVRVDYNGTVQPTATNVGSGLGSLGDVNGPPEADALVAFPSAQQMGLVLTGGRILVWSLGFSRKPKAYLGEVPLSAVAEVHAGEVRFGPLMRLVMKSGASVDLEVPHKEDGKDEFIDHLHFLVGSGTDSRRSTLTGEVEASGGAGVDAVPDDGEAGAPGT